MVRRSTHNIQAHVVHLETPFAAPSKTTAAAAAAVCTHSMLTERSLLSSDSESSRSVWPYSWLLERGW